MKVVSIVGARPQFVKAAVVSRAIEKRNNDLLSEGEKIEEHLVHTGQHYDDEMSRVFFDELSLSQPQCNLGVGSSAHGKMTGEMLVGLEEALLAEKPDCVIIYGDTNSTLAGALAASKLHIPIAHVEAGLRSFNRRMPEEINRVVADHVSNMLFCPTQIAVSNLEKEGIREGVFLVGDVMFDAFSFYRGVAESRSQVLDSLGIQSGSYLLATVHRAENTDYPERLRGIFEAFQEIASPENPLVLPVHPRTRNVLAESLPGLKKSPFLQLISPVGYLDMLCLLLSARVVLTDSGGLQKEAYFAKVPCITLRDETEWVETVESKYNVLVGAEKEKIIQTYHQSAGKRLNDDTHSHLFGNGTAGEEIVEFLIGFGTAKGGVRLSSK